MSEVLITREPDDPIALRASIGGPPDLGYYLVFRGDPEQVLAMLREVLARAEQRFLTEDYTDKRGRPQG